MIDVISVFVFDVLNHPERAALSFGAAVATFLFFFALLTPDKASE